MDLKKFKKKILISAAIAVLSLNFLFISPQTAKADDCAVLGAVAGGLGAGLIGGLAGGGGFDVGSTLESLAGSAIDVGLGVLTGGLSGLFGDALGGVLGGGPDKVIVVTADDDKREPAKEAADTAEKGDCWTRTIQPMLQKTAQQAAVQLVRNLTESTIEWIRSGFNGNPAYIGDPISFLTKTADQTVGEMIFNDPNLNFLCAPFRNQVRLRLGLTYQQSTSFYNKINCTLSDVINNVENAGFDTWIQLSLQPSNTPLGAYIIAENELQSRIAAKKDAVILEAGWGKGALTYQSCTKQDYRLTPLQAGQAGPPTPVKVGNPTPLNNVGSQYYVPGKTTVSRDGSYSVITCSDKTPGAAITDLLGFSLQSDQRSNELRATLSNGINDVVAALLHRLTTDAIDRIKNALGEPNPQNQIAINQAFASALTQTQQSFNDSLNNRNSLFSSSSLSSYRDILGEDYISQFSDIALTGVTASEFGTAKDRARAIVNALIQREQDYQQIINDVLRIDNDSKTAFIAARTCNTLLNTSTSTLRAMLIYQNAIENIDGITDSARSIPNIGWNIPYLNSLLTTSGPNVTFLNGVLGAIDAATTTDGLVNTVTSSILPIERFNNPATLGATTTGSGGGNFSGGPAGSNQGLNASTTTMTGLRTFLIGVQNIYSTRDCPIDLRLSQNNR